MLGNQQGALSQLVLAALSKAVKEMMSEVTEARALVSALIFADYVARKSLPAFHGVAFIFLCQVSPSAQVWTMKLSLQAPPFSQALRAELQPAMKGSLRTMLRIVGNT